MNKEQAASYLLGLAADDNIAIRRREVALLAKVAKLEAEKARLETAGDILAAFVKGAEFANPQEWVCGEALREDWQEAKDAK